MSLVVSQNRIKMLWSLAYILREDPRRRFVFGFTIEDVSMRLWFCSRSDVFVSKPFDFMEVSDLHSKFSIDTAELKSAPGSLFDDPLFPEHQLRQLQSARLGS